MDYISDRVLMEAYEKALELELEEDFIELLRSEMIRRGMPDPSPSRYLQVSQ